MAIVVVAQVVERWHSIRASWVRFLVRTWLGSFWFCIAVNLFSLAVRPFLKKHLIEKVVALPPFSLIHIIIYHCKIYQL